MPNLKMPVVHGDKSTFPDEALCPWCRKRKVLEPHSFAFIDGGALLMDRLEDSGGPSEDMEAYLCVGWHGSHPEEGGEGSDAEIDSQVRVAHSVIGGQFGLYFCSTECLRAFLNHCIDKLEWKLKRQRKLRTS
jgi:hypothetical protein